jgi:glycogen synthase
MRILHLTPEFPPLIWGGLGTAVGGLVGALARAGDTVGVLLIGGVLAEDGSYGGLHPVAPLPLGDEVGQVFVSDEGVTFFHVTTPDATDASARLVLHWQPDVVHIHSAWLWPTAQAIQQLTSVPVVFTVHSIDRVEYECGLVDTHWRAQEAVMAGANRVVAISQSERTLLKHYCPAVDAKVSVIGNGIEETLAIHRAVQRRQTMLTRKAPLVMYSGRFVARKGIQELLKAIPLVLAQAPDTQFVLVGGYGGGAEIERAWMADELRPYQSHVHFTGWLAPAQVADWYRAADILVVPSWYEPFGMVILEGMLHGLALAAANIGGPSEIIEHNRTGLLFEPQDVDSLSDALLRLVQNPALRRKLGKAAAEQVRDKWLWSSVVEQFREVYQDEMLR